MSRPYPWEEEASRRRVPGCREEDLLRWDVSGRHFPSSPPSSAEASSSPYSSGRNRSGGRLGRRRRCELEELVWGYARRNLAMLNIFIKVGNFIETNKHTLLKLKVFFKKII